LLEQHAEFTYYPVDISENILAELAISLRGMFPPLKFHPLNYEYFEALKQLNKLSNRKNVILFLGSNIGNFHFEEAEVFIKELADNSKRNDMLLIGVDLKKDPNIIQLAYDDPKGITAAFNLNLLNRMNHELGANFDLNRFEHLAFYEQKSGEMLSYIVSLFDQKVYFEVMDISFNFEKGERIHTEVSKKYSMEELRILAEGQGLELTKYFTDSNKYFTDVLLTIK
jgi:dimethylhistidine N-methyltransferase